MKNKFFSIALALLFLALVSAIATAGQEVLVTSDSERGFNPAIYDDKVVWTDNIFDGNVYMRDLSTGKEIQITNQSVSSPAIYGDRVVWVHGKNIYVYNISSGTETRIPAADSISEGQKAYLGIHGDKIVWEDNRDRNDSSGNWNIYVYDLSTSRETRITSTPITTRIFATEVAIYGDRIVWLGNRIDNETILDDIYMYDLSTSTETQITTNGSAWSPKIYEDRIVYTDSRSGRPNIYLYNISTSTETQITTSGLDHSISGIYGNRIVWEDNRNENWDIYMYDLSTSTEVQITTDISDQRKPAIYGDRIVWQDYRNTDPNNYYCEIYMYDFSDKPVVPFASFTTNVTSGSGNVPLTVLFTDTSAGGEPASWHWDFGDGITSKHAQTATHTFTKAGTYNVSLTVTSSAGSTTVKKSNCITVTPPQAPLADFFSPRVEQVRSYGGGIFVNETLLFMDNSTGSPTSWLWDFGDGTTSTAQNPAHTYNAKGGYTVNLTVTNSIGSDTTGTYGYVLVGIIDESASPAHFSSNITNGSTSLTVVFHDDDADKGIDPIWREWNFGDGVTQFYRVDNNKSATPYASHTYEKPGKYTVTLDMDNRGGRSIITKYNYITVTGPDPADPAADPGVPVANFTTNVTEGHAPLSVQFNDFSRNATSRTWDFNNDGQTDSNDPDPVYMYAVPGTYTVNLTAINANGTASKAATIIVLESNSNDGSNSDKGNSHSSGSSSGGGGGSPEPAKNIEAKELCQATVTNGKEVKFDFTKNATCVVYVSFDAKRTMGKTTTIVEMLKGKSALVSELPSGEVYKSFNVWVGNGGIATSKNIENSAVCFKVEKSWIREKDIDQDSITLNLYNDEKWEQLPVSLSKEDNELLYFTAKTPRFASFTITGEAKSFSGENETGAKFESETRAVDESSIGNKGPEAESGIIQKENMSAPDFGIIYGLTGLLAVFLYRRK